MTYTVSLSEVKKSGRPEADWDSCSVGTQFHGNMTVSSTTWEVVYSPLSDQETR